MSNLAAVALEYFRAGLAVIPVHLDGSKAPAVKRWRHWIKQRQTERDVLQIFADPSGLAVLGGPMSGGLEIIDFDRGDMFHKWRDLVDSLAPGLTDRLPIVATPSGHHVYLRSAKCAPNQKLALSREKNAAKKSNVLIETRGDGGYVIAPPSPPEVHPTKIPYAWISGPKLTEIPTLTDAEHDVLISAARSFNEVVKEEPGAPRSQAPKGEGRPGDEFSQRVSWHDILTPHGWKPVRTVGKTTHWRRPGKDEGGISATTGYTGDKLYVFSTSATPFEAQRAYGKFSAYAWLNHGGDWSAAARDLKDRGFGEQSRPRPAKAEPKPTWDALTTEAQPPPPSDADAPAHLEAPEGIKPMGCAELEPLLDDDIGSALKPAVFARIMATRDDRAEWFRILDLLRRRRCKRDFLEAVKEHEREHGKARRRPYKNGDWRSQLLYRENRSGELVLETCSKNLIAILENDAAWLGVLAWDEFSNQITLRRPPPFERGKHRWDDSDASETKAWIEENYEVRPTTTAVCEAVLAVCSRHRFNPLTDYLDSLEDHDQEVLDTWLIDFFGAPDTPYVRAVGAKWMISAVARAYDPGCKVDTCLILEGEQGLKKSRVLEQLCTNLEWFTDGLSDFGSRSQAEEIEGKWIVELGELKGFGRELEQIKAFVTRRAENYRPAYARYMRHSPRKCVFAGTVNPSSAGYLRDETGNRRFWPVECKTQGPEMTTELRDKLWSEAKARYFAGERWYFRADEDKELIEQATREQSARVFVDPWHELIEGFVIGKTETSIDEILGDCLKIEKAKWSNAEAQRVGRVLVQLRWLKFRKREGSKLSWRYRPPPLPAYSAPEDEHPLQH